MKKNVVLGLLVALLAFGFVGCDDDNDDPPPAGDTYYLWSEIDVVATQTFTILSINSRDDFNPFSLSAEQAQQYWDSLFAVKNSLDDDNIRMSISELREIVLPEIGNDTNLMNQLEAHLVSKGNILFLGGAVDSPVNSQIPEEGIVFVVKE